MMEVHAYGNDGAGFSMPYDVYQGLEALWIEDFDADQVKNAKFAREALADLTGKDSGAHIVFVALDTDGRAVGTCFAIYEDHSRLLDGAFVTAHRRGEKIFSAIMKKVNDVATLHGITAYFVQPSKRALEYWAPALGRWGFTARDDDPDTLIYPAV